MLDASVSLRWFLDDPVPAYARKVQQLLLGGRQALVPALWLLEMANGLAVAERRGAMSPSDTDRSLDNLDHLLAQAFEVDSASVSARDALAAARAFHLSAYDAAYLILARRERVPIATLDEALRAAARRAAVELVR